MPNAFCPTCPVDPNNPRSPLNLTFLPAGVNLSVYHLQVFDQIGHLLFETKSLDIVKDPINGKGRPDEGWDGTFNGVLMPQGTYMWKISAIFNDGVIWTGSNNGINQSSTMGTITLIR